MSRERARSGLTRELGVLTTTLFTAAMIVGTGIFAAFGAATNVAGSGILVAMLLGGSVALATGISAAQLGVNFPEEGGAFTWARQFDHDTIGFIAGCGYLGKVLVSMSVIALAFATYVSQAIPGLPAHLAAAIAVLGMTGLNVFGIELTSKMLIALLAVLVGLLALYSGAAVGAVDPANLGPILGDNGPLGLLAGAAIFFWSWDGFMRAAIMASEVKDPRRAIPFGIVGGVAIAAVVFLTVGAITLGVLGANAVGAEDTPLLAAGKKAADWAFWVVLAAAIVATLVDMLGVLLTGSRVVLAMAKAREVPEWFARVHERLGTPVRSVVALGIASAALVLVFDLRPLIEVASAFMLVWYLVTHYAALALPKEKRITSLLFSWYGIVGCVGLLVALPPPALAVAGAAFVTLLGTRWVIRRASLPTRR